jgi:endonuclease/exonuclease/phosphatase family metal-dependent hydrolase
MRKRFITTLFIALLTLLCYASVLFPPSWWWFAGFLSLAIPVFLVLQFVLIFYWLFYRKYYYALLALLVLAFGFPFIKASFTMHSNPKSRNRNKSFAVLTYNVQVFNAYSKKNNNYALSKNTLNWVKYDNAAIKCLQEFYYMPNHTVFNTLAQLGKAEKYKYYFKPALTDKNNGQFGLAIFTKFPIIRTGEVNLQDKSYNDAIFADLLVFGDTIRVYNVHLQSMKINKKRMTDTDKWKENLVDLAQRLRYGFSARANQINLIAEHIANCKHKVILCGDLNDVPYSYTYFRLKKMLDNAFEEAGNGFGFSLNSSIFYVRIDNQFCSSNLQVLDYETHNEVIYSDHFPVRSVYALQ